MVAMCECHPFSTLIRLLTILKPLLVLAKSFGMIKTLLEYIFYSLENTNFMVTIVTIRYFREVFRMVTILTIGISGTVF